MLQTGRDILPSACITPLKEWAQKSKLLPQCPKLYYIIPTLINNSPLNSQNLIRIIVSRCDIDLGNIKREYEKKFNRSLLADVSVLVNLILFFKTKIYFLEMN